MHPSSIVAEELFGPEYTKRFNEILLARIAAVLKRTRGNTEKTSIFHEDVRLDLLKCTISCEEKEMELTKNELKILHLLFMHDGNYVASQDLIE